MFVQFNINIVAPVLYVEFTSLSITASAILFKELSNLAYTNIVALLLGFLVIVVGLFLVSSFKDLKFGWRNWFRFLFRRAHDAADGDAEPHTEMHSEAHFDSGVGGDAAHSDAANGSESVQLENGTRTPDGPVAKGVSAGPTASPAAAFAASGASQVCVPGTDEPKQKRKKNARSRDTSVKISLKNKWYRITDLNRFGSRRRRGVKRLVSAKLSDPIGAGDHQTSDPSHTITKSNTLESGVYENDSIAIEEEVKEVARDGEFTGLETAPPVTSEHELRVSEDLSVGELGASSASVAQLLSRSEESETHSNPFVAFATTPASTPSSSAPQVAISLENFAPLPPPPVLSRKPSRASSPRGVGSSLELDSCGDWKGGGGVERARPRPASRSSIRSSSPQPLSSAAPADASALSVTAVTSIAYSNPERLTSFKLVDLVG